MKDYGNIYSVYVLTFPDGRKYVGMTRQEVKKRWRGGSGYKNTKRVSEAINKFGWESVKHEVIKENLSLNEASKLEKELIAKFETQNPSKGLNTKNGGQTSEHNEAFKKALSERMKGNTYCVGRKLSKSHIKALADANRGSHRPSPFKGLHIWSEEDKKNLSEKAKKRWENPEYRQKIKESARDLQGVNNPMYGRKQSEETKKLIGSKAKERFKNDPTLRLRINASKKGVGRKVNQYLLDGTLVATFSCCKYAGLAVGGNGTNVSYCCKHPTRTYKGFKWGYAE